MLWFLVCLAALAAVPRAHGYSVLTHQAIIDTAWEENLKPLLLARFPQATAGELRKAHAYAYGGSIIQDMGYYPFGSKFFSDLVHYVRSGDFVEALLAEARDPNEYAFALGALAHYASDTVGHPVAVNVAVAIEYPRLARKFGPRITYADSPAAHLKTEFGFDVLQVARGHYAPEAYHDFIGFEVSKPVLERAFRHVYSLELAAVFASVDLALGTYRHTVSGILPAATRAAWTLRKDELVRARPGLTRDRFIYKLSRAAYEKEWGGAYEKPGAGARVIAFFFRLVPKIGPFKSMAFHPPTPPAVELFMDSFNRTVELYRRLLADTRAKRLSLLNRDFDTGRATRPGEYPLADKTYCELARKLAGRDPGSVGSDVRAAVLGFFRAAPPALADHSGKHWQETAAALSKLRQSAAAPGR